MIKSTEQTKVYFFKKILYHPTGKNLSKSDKKYRTNQSLFLKILYHPTGKNSSKGEKSTEQTVLLFRRI